MFELTYVSIPYRNTIPGAPVNQDQFFNQRQSIPSTFRGNPDITAREWGQQCMRARSIARTLGRGRAHTYMTKRGASLTDAFRTLVAVTPMPELI